MLERESVRSSVARRLGVPDAGLGPEDRRAEGMVEMVLDATKNHIAARKPPTPNMNEKRTVSALT